MKVSKSILRCVTSAAKSKLSPLIPCSSLLGIPSANKLLRSLADEVAQRLPRVVVRWVAGPVHKVVNQRAPINCDLLLASQLLSLPYALLLACWAEPVVLRDLLHLRLGRQALHVVAHLCAGGGDVLQ